MCLKKFFNKIIRRDNIQNNSAIYIHLNYLCRNTIYASTTMGKSKILASLLMKTVGKSESVVVFDPKGDERLKEIHLKYRGSHLFTLMDASQQNHDKYNPMKNLM